MYLSGLWACLGCCPLEAQSSIQLGLGLHGQATMTGQTVPGMGNSFQLWAEAPLNTGLALYGALGRQSYSGYNSGFIAFEKIRRSFETQLNIRSIRLSALSFWGIDLGLAIGSRQTEQPWSCRIALRAARLTRHKGRTEEATAQSQTVLDDSSANANSPNNFRPQLQSQYYSTLVASRPLSDELRGYDIGISASVCYRLTKGLRLELGAYQGGIDQWSAAYPGSTPLLITSFSLGLLARLH